MERVTEVMGKLMELFPGGDVPLQNPQSPPDEYGRIYFVNFDHSFCILICVY